jgi:hypothetical protein
MGDGPSDDIRKPPYMDDSAFLVPGTPGYRNRPGRSGLDYLDTQFEFARMEGIFLRHLFTGSLRASAPLYLYGMLLLGILCVAPAIMGLLFNAPFNTYTIFSWCYVAVMAPVGMALLVNFVRNIRSR